VLAGCVKCDSKLKRHRYFPHAAIKLETSK
jgi:hypothetical protein